MLAGVIFTVIRTCNFPVKQIVFVFFRQYLSLLLKIIKRNMVEVEVTEVLNEEMTKITDIPSHVSKYSKVVFVVLVKFR